MISKSNMKNLGGRPKVYKEPRSTFILRLPESLMQRLRELTQLDNSTLTELINKAIKQYINN
jgi:predicted DNA-binding protein